MKKSWLLVLVAVALTVSCAVIPSLTISSAGNVYTALMTGTDTNGGVAAYDGTTFLFSAGATYFNSLGNRCVAMRPISFKNGAVATYGNVTSISEMGVGALGDASTKHKGTRRTQLFSFDSTVPAGTYTLSIMVCDRDDIMSNRYADFGALVTLHTAETTDATLAYNWYVDSNSAYTVKVFDTHDPYVSATPADAYMDATCTRAATPKADASGNWNWYEYTCTVVLTQAVSKAAIWLYQPGDGFGTYDNRVVLAEGRQVYLDSLTLTRK